MLGAGRMTATTRADIGASIFKPDGDAGGRGLPTDV